MPWACKIGDRSLRLEDIEISVLDDIAKQFSIDWIQLVYVPAGNAAAGPALVRKCAEIMGVDAPEKFTPRVLLDSFVEVDDDSLPETFTDGVPTPGAEAENQTE